MTYSARDHYRNEDVVTEYERRRFSGWLGGVRWAAEQEAVRQVIERLPPSSTILDCPVGNGRWAEVLIGLGHEVTGVDISEVMIEAATARLRPRPDENREPPRLLRMNAEKLTFSPGSFDVVFSHALTKHLPPEVQDRVFAEFVRASRSAVVCSFSVLTGLSGALWRLRRIPEAYGRTWEEIDKLAGIHGLRVDLAVPCTTRVGVEQTILFVRQ